MASGNNIGGGARQGMMRGPSADEMRSGIAPRQYTQAAPTMQQAGYGASDINPLGSPMASRATLAQQRRNAGRSVAAQPFNQFTGGAQYIGAANGAQLGQPNLGQGVLYDYGNGQYKFGTDQNNLQDIYGNWTFLRS